MQQPLNKSVRRLFIGVLALQALIVVGLAGFSVWLTSALSYEVAEQVVKLVRRDLVVGDLRQAVTSTANALGDRFEAIAYFTESGERVFSIPSSLSPGAFESLRQGSQVFWEVRVFKIALDEVGHQFSGEMVFVSQRLRYLPFALGVWLLSLGVSVPLFASARRSIIRRHESQVELQRKSAVAAMTAMLAHDVRRPFSTLKMGLDAIAGATDGEIMGRIAKRLIPEIERSLVMVNGLIADTMEATSSKTNLKLETVPLAKILDGALEEVFLAYPKADVTLTYDFNHRLLLNIDVLKVVRVFSNLCMNAVQAMKQRGRIWIASRQITVDGRPYAQVYVGNDGAFIPPEVRADLFNLFFTTGKRGGTGLGLAIAQKVVTAHGGSIRCESRKDTSNPQGIVEFILTLPLSEADDCTAADILPSQSSAYSRRLERTLVDRSNRNTGLPVPLS